MGKHVWEWDKRSSKPMMVVCTNCKQRVPLAEVLRVGCDDCSVEGVQEGLFDGKDRRENIRARKEDN